MSVRLNSPNFLYAGASKSGSSWIYQILKEHPQVFVPTAKEILFFDRYYERGEKWYQSFFKGSENFLAAGELSHDYFLHRDTAQKIYDYDKNMLLIFCLRERVDFVQSLYKYDRTIFERVTAKEYQKGLSLYEFAMRPDIIMLSDFATNLQHFYKLFPRENILVLFFDDLQKNPETFAKNIYRFIGVDPIFSPPSLHKRINTARDVRSILLANLAFRGGQILRALGLPGVLGYIKRMAMFERVFYKQAGSQVQSPTVTEKELADITQKYRLQYGDLEKLIGIHLPSGWYQPSA